MGSEANSPGPSLTKKGASHESWNKRQRERLLCQHALASSSQTFAAQYLCLFSPRCLGYCGRFIFRREKAARFGGTSLLQAPAHFGPHTGEGELNVHGLGWAGTSISLGRV